MLYADALKYLNSFIDYEKLASDAYWGTFKLSRMRRFLNFLGRPQDGLKCVHIAGTKGKGSTCAMLASILASAGYKVGLYTSPHLIDYRERIQVLRETPLRQGFGGQAWDVGRRTRNAGMLIPKKDICALIELIKPAVKKIKKIPKLGPLSFFEVYTALALLYFKQQQVDIAVLEVGLGGRLDATNVVRPLACAIAPISLEHTNRLGNSLREIAYEKAGIIKDGISVVSACQKKDVVSVLKAVCRKRNAGLFFPGKNGSKVPTSIEIGLKGPHQRENASVAVSLAQLLKGQGYTISQDAIRRGLKCVSWPGRLQVLKKRPFVVVDGAQNADSAKALARAVKICFKYKRLILVLGVCADKDVKGICENLAGLSSHVILTQSKNPRAMDAGSILASLLNALKFSWPKNIHIDLIRDSKDALKRALSLAANDDLVLVTGSFYLIGEIKSQTIP